MYHVCKLSINLIGVYSQDYRVIISSSPAGELINGSTYDYPKSSNLSLTCLAIQIISKDGSSSALSNFRWKNTGCSTNRRHTASTCFPTNQTTQTVTGKNLLAEDAGTITCTVSIGGVDYTSEPFTLHISGIHNVLKCVLL